MAKIKMAVAALALLAIGACSVGPSANSTATGGGAVAGVARYAVEDVRITVPRSLKVSEANLFYPVADIVWRGEPFGDRHAQIEAMMREAATAATASMNTGQNAIVDVEVTRFHAVTEKARYSIGGVHSLRFNLTVRDAKTGAILEGPRPINADVRAAGGDDAIRNDQIGRTQRVVIVERLTNTFRTELSSRSAP